MNISTGLSPILVELLSYSFFKNVSWMRNKRNSPAMTLVLQNI